jgi:DNA-binding transcriptional LysR family regulator
LPVGAVVSANHPIATRAAVSIEDCVAYPVILPDQSWPLRALLDTLIAASDVQLNIATWSNSVEFLRLMLDQEQGIGFQTVVGIEDKVDRGELVLVPLHNPEPISQVFAICARDDLVLSAPPRRFFELLEGRLDEYASLPV